MRFISLSSAIKANLTQSPKLPLIFLGTTLIAACVTATKPLWRMDQAASGCSHAFGTLMGSAGDIYQTCPPSGGAEGWLRKLNSDGAEQWRQPMNFWSDGGLVADADNSVILFHDKNQMTWINADGSQRWRRDVVPQGSYIFEKSRVANGRVYVAYQENSSPFTKGIVALDAAGNELWSYPLNEDGVVYTSVGFALLDSGELLVKLTLEDEDYLNVRGQLLVFDTQGNLAQKRDEDKYSRLIDNKKTVYLIEKNIISLLDATGAAQWSYPLYPLDDTSTDFFPAYPCAGDGQQEMACSNGNTITWLAGDGTVKNYLNIGAIGSLTYSGDRKWLATRETSYSLPAVGSQKTETDDSVFVLSDRGAIEQKIYMNPMIETTYFCPSNPPYYSCVKRNNGDKVSQAFATADKVIVSGYTGYSSSTFISAFSLGAQ